MPFYNSQTQISVPAANSIATGGVVPAGKSLFLKRIRVSWSGNNVPQAGGSIISIGTSTTAGGAGFVSLDSFLTPGVASNLITLDYDPPMPVAAGLFPCVEFQTAAGTLPILYYVSWLGTIQ